MGGERTARPGDWISWDGIYWRVTRADDGGVHARAWDKDPEALPEDVRRGRRIPHGAYKPAGPSPAGLLQIALRLARTYGWVVIPVNGKKPVAQWMQFQRRTPSRGELERLFRAGGVTGLAVILGSASRGLVCRDFDDPGAYAKWKRRFPALARRLPTVKTARGYHVYFRGPEAFTEYGDGEYRGDAGHYAVLPPSAHPAGGFYKWVVPLRADIPLVEDPVEMGLRSRDKGGLHIARNRSMRAMGTMRPMCKHPDTPDVDPSGPEVERAIQDTLPDAPGVRHRQVFNLVLRLKAIPELRDRPPEAFQKVVRVWHAQALRFVNTKDFADTWYDFKDGWRRFDPERYGKLDDQFKRALATEPLPHLVDRYGEASNVVKLEQLCRLKQKEAGGEPFHVATRQAARLLGVTHTSAAKYFRLLVDDNVIRVQKRGEPGHATDYRYVFDPKTRRR